MQKKVYTIMDRKAKSIGPLVLAVDNDDILRSVRDALRGDSLMSRYPDDFDLLQVGVVDLSTGALLPPYDGPLVVCNLSDIKSQERDQ